MIKSIREKKSSEYYTAAAKAEQANARDFALVGSSAKHTMGYSYNEIEADYYNALGDIYNTDKPTKLVDIMKALHFRKLVKERHKKADRALADLLKLIYKD